MGLFRDRATVLRFSRLRVVYVAVFVCAFVLTELGRFAYRPYAYSAGLDDFGLANTMGNSLGVVTQVFCLLAVMHSSWRQGLKVIAFAVCGYIAYECLQPILPKGTFDVKDIIATAVGGVIALVVLWLAKHFAGDRVVGDASIERKDAGAS